MTPDRKEEAPAAPGGNRRKQPTVSSVLEGGRLVELVYDPAKQRTRLVVGQGDGWTFADSVPDGRGGTLVPYSSRNTLIRNGVVLLPSQPEEYGSEEALLTALQEYIGRYVALEPGFVRLASVYALLSWVYDRFNEVPYLRVRGDYGTGKTRFLLVVGSLCYKPIFASGASTVSPLFHMLDAFGGTLVFDEADFRFSDEKAEVVKILNNGNVRGLPVLRTMVSPKGEYSPRAFQVFGPKLVATRGFYDDRALESRFITEDLSHEPLPEDIPTSLPDRFAEEARGLRNRLLAYRLRRYHGLEVTDQLVDPRIEPRARQIFAPLLAVAPADPLRGEIRALARRHSEELALDRAFDVEAQVLSVIHALFEDENRGRVTVRDVTEAFAGRYGRDYERHVTPRWIGSVIRRGLRLATVKRRGVFVIPVTEVPKIERLLKRYGLAPGDGPEEAADTVSLESKETSSRVDMVDMGDIPA